MLCRLFFLLVLACIVSARAQNQTVITSREPTSIEKNGSAKFTGFTLTDGELLLTGDEALVSTDQTTFTVTGHVVLTHRATRLLADKLVYHRADGSFEAEHVRLGAFPYFAEGESASGTIKEITLVHATATYGEPSPWHPTMIADKIIYTPGQRLRTENSRVGIGHAQPVPLPHLTQTLHDPLISYASLTGGFRHSLGVFAEAGLHLPTPAIPDLKLGGDLGVYTSRGIMFGPSGSYARSDDTSGELRGSFRSGYINDHGDKKTDLLGRPVPEDRAYVEWQHVQQLGDNLSLTAQLNWWRDSEVLRDFRPRAFFPVQQPDTFAEATYAGKNYFVSLFTRLRPNNFERVQERAPELRFDLLPTAIGGGFYERFNASVAFLHERLLADGNYAERAALPPQTFSVPIVDPAISVLFPSSGGIGAPILVVPNPTAPRTIFATAPSADALLSGGPEQRATRLDAYYSLARPIVLGDYFSFTPVAGARLTHYANVQESVLRTTSAVISPPGATPTINQVTEYAELAPMGNHSRTLGELGFDAALRTSGTFDYKNAQWKIDGLRHLFTPRLSYRYIPDANRYLGRIPAIDRQTLSPYLPPLGLGDQRNIDDLRSASTLRLEFDNTLQTRDPVYGSRDLVTLNIANDFRFDHTPLELPTSEIHAELGIMPARWLEISVYQSRNPKNLATNEFNSAITLRDGDRWTLRFANNFFHGWRTVDPRAASGFSRRGGIEDYAVDGSWRLHERFDALTRLHYDARKRRFTEQAYGLVQNLDNTWRISYVVSLYEGRARESRFGLNLQIEAVGF